MGTLPMPDLPADHQGLHARGMGCHGRVSTSRTSTDGTVRGTSFGAWSALRRC